MPRVHHRKARKSYPYDGIAKGDMYYTATLKTGPRSSRVLRSKTPFKRSQLTTSEFLGTLYDIEDDLQNASTVEHLENAAERFQELADETQEKLDNMPEGLQEGDVGQLLQERIEGCEAAQAELEQIIDEINSSFDQAKEITVEG